MKRVRTPKVIQMEAVECGVASLSIILRYYGRYVPLEVLRIECGVSRDGSNAANLIKAAKKYGLTGAGFRKTADELKEIEGPVILFWAYQHFLVLEGFSKNRVFLNDPAVGPISMPYEEFAEMYSGVVLTFEKTAAFQPGGSPEPFAKQIWLRLKVAPYPLLFTFLTGICLVLPGLAMPAFLMFFIDAFFGKRCMSFAGPFLGAVLSTAIFAGLLNWLRLYYLNRLNAKLSLRFSSEFFWHLLRLPMEFYYQRFYGEVAFRTTLNESVVQTLTGSFLAAAIDLLLIVFYGAVMLAYDSAIACIGIFAGVLNLALLSWVYRLRADTYTCLQQDLAKSVAVSIGGLQCIESIKFKAAESDFFAKWAGHNTRTINAHQEIGKKDIVLTTVPVFFQLLAGAALLGLGSLRVMDGSLTIGMLMSMQLLQMNFLLPINRFVGFSQVMQNMKIDNDRLNDVLKNTIDSRYLQKGEPLTDQLQLKGRLEFRNVTFGYGPLDPPLIKDLSFTIEPGRRLAFVGHTGSGKSTVAYLASGLLHPWSGEIFYDGVLIHQIPKELFSNSVATVDQSIFLFEGTIRENLTLWNTTIPEEVLIAACRDAAIHEEIIARPHSYDAPLIEGGRNLSGGERQRLEIARALLYNPTLLILDEATSALDSKTEREIADRIRRRGCSALMIAHRLSTIQDCDEIIVLEKGQVSQRGHHEELRKEPGIYQNLINSELAE